MGSVQQIRVKWNHHQSNFPKVFENLLHKKEFVDVTLSCEGQSLNAHRMVLSACSPYFHTLFIENPCKHPIVIMKDYKFSDIEAIVEYMYKGEVNIGRDSLREFLRTAHSLQIKGLADDDNNDSVETNNRAFSHPEPDKVPEILPPRLTKPLESQSMLQRESYSHPTPSKRMRIEKPPQHSPVQQTTVHPSPIIAAENIPLPLVTTLASQPTPEVIKPIDGEQVVKMEVKGEVSEFRYNDDSNMDESQELDQTDESPDPDAIILGEEPEVIEEEPEIMFGQNNSQDGRLSQTADSLTSTLMSALRDGAGPSSSPQLSPGEGSLAAQRETHAQEEEKIWSYFEYAPPDVLSAVCFLCGTQVAMTLKKSGERSVSTLFQHMQAQHRDHYFRTMQPADSIWRHFEFVPPEVCQVTCLLCNNKVARGRYHNSIVYGSSNLFQHLKRHHPKEYSVVQKPARMKKSPRPTDKPIDKTIDIIGPKQTDNMADTGPKPLELFTSPPVRPKPQLWKPIFPKGIDLLPFMNFLQRDPR